jgi:hypothetical protein
MYRKENIASYYQTKCIHTKDNDLFTYLILIAVRKPSTASRNTTTISKVKTINAKNTSKTPVRVIAKVKTPVPIKSNKSKSPARVSIKSTKSPGKTASIKPPIKITVTPKKAVEVKKKSKMEILQHDLILGAATRLLKGLGSEKHTLHLPILTTAR